MEDVEDEKQKNFFKMSNEYKKYQLLGNKSKVLFWIIISEMSRWHSLVNVKAHQIDEGQIAGSYGDKETDI